LNRDQTVRVLYDHELRRTHDGVVILPERIPVAGDPVPALGQYRVDFEPELVWQIERDEKIRSMRIASSGTVLINDRLLLDTDFGSVPGIADRPWKKRRCDVEIAVIPWSHKWATYYEFVVHILPKLCRIKEVMDPHDFEIAKLCYPLMGTPYERPYLSLLGIGDDALLNTRDNIEIVARSIVVSNLQANGRLPSPTGILALRRAFLADPPPDRGQGRRLYLSRGGHKRRVLNEADVLRLVSSFGLEVVDPSPVSVTDQIRMFQDASLIVSPHGSALTNLVWCAPGTRVIELFTKSFTPPMYAYLSHVLDLQYACVVDDANDVHHWTHMHRDMVVDIRSLATALQAA
jgi:hypothetical protein